MQFDNVSVTATFAEWSNFPNLNGSLLASVSPAPIKEANKAEKSVTNDGKSKRRGSYAKFSTEQQAALGKYGSTQQPSDYLALL